MAGYLRATCNWSNGEVARFRGASRLVDHHEAVGEAWSAGHIGSAQIAELSRAHGNQRVADRETGPGRTLRQRRFDRDVETLLEGATFDVTFWRVIDNDRDDRNPIFRRPSNIEASNGIVHTVNQVLRPIDL